MTNNQLLQMRVRSEWTFTMARLSARHCKHPYRSPAHILSTTFKLCLKALQIKSDYVLHAPI